MRWLRIDAPGEYFNTEEQREQRNTEGIERFQDGAIVEYR